VQTPGEYAVAAVTRGNKVNTKCFGNHDLSISIAGSSVSATAGIQDMDMSDDAPWTQYPRSPMGTIQIGEAGEQNLQLVADRVDAEAVNGLKLLAVELTPVMA
jgi:hypothetical protein